MHTVAFALAGLLALPLAAQSPVSAPTSSSVVGDLVIRLSDTGNARGFATASFDDTTYEVLRDAHALHRVTTLTGFPLPGGVSVDLTLRPVDVWEAGGKARVFLEDGSVQELAPSIQLFAAHVSGRESTGFLGISREMLHGYLSLGEDTYFLSTGSDDGTRKPLAISHQDVFLGAGSDFCNVLSDKPSQTTTQPQTRAGLAIWETKVFIECDNKFRARFSSNQATIDYATLLVGASSEIYRRDLGATMTIPNGHVQVWNTTPPWGKITTFGDISAFRSWWNSPANPNKSVARSQVHVFSYPVFGGVAWGIGILCQKTNSYAISSIYGSFPYPIRHTSSSNWDLYVFSHESGHLYGSQHTFDYQPPINCNDGSGPDKGTIMSYCHQTYGVGGVGMRFHKRVQDNMRPTISAAACVNTIPIRLGDYNGDDLIDQIDTDAFDSVIGQGFVSRAAEEVFDMDGDGTLTAFDRQLLLAAALPAASSSTFNGSGTNCSLCYTPVTQPVLGTTWSTFVGSYIGAPILTTILGKTQRLATPLATQFGELLITGPNVFTHNAMTNGQFATHDILLPLDPGLAGIVVETQAVMFKPTGAELVNGITIQVSTY